jgi:hypothetical protein
MQEETKVVIVGGVCIAAIAALALWSGTPGHKRISAPDGKPAWLISCSSPAGCLDESSETCPAGYSVLSRDEKRGTSTTYTNVGAGNGTSIGIPVTSDTYSGATLIRCNGDT